MKYEPDKHHRCSIRLNGYDYSRSGAYFVTICTQGRECLFGDVVDGEMRVNDAGAMIHRIWNDLSVKYPDVETDGFVVMPNHFHGIIIIVGAGPRACPGIHAGHEFGAVQPQGVENAQTQKHGQAQGPAPTGLSLSDVVHRFKSFTTAEYRNGVRQKNWPACNGKLWQRNYYEHIIRNEKEMDRIRTYIIENPAKWVEDEDNPGNIIRRGHDVGATPCGCPYERTNTLCPPNP